MMKASEVKYEMVERFFEEIESQPLIWHTNKALIAAAYNATQPADDDEAITAEWLRSVGYEQEGQFLCTQVLGFVRRLRFAVRKGETVSPLFFLGHFGTEVNCDCDIKTRGQLRAWHKAFGQELVEKK